MRGTRKSENAIGGRVLVSGELFDWVNYHATEREAVFESNMVESTNFDLVVRFACSEYLLVCVMYVLLCDGWYVCGMVCRGCGLLSKERFVSERSLQPTAESASLAHIC